MHSTQWQMHKNWSFRGNLLSISMMWYLLDQSISRTETLRFLLAQKEGVFNNGQAIYLHDKDLGTYTNLQNGNYSFTANAGEFANRFEIVYKLNVLGTTEVSKDSFEVYREGEDFYVRNDKNIETVEVFDASGRKVMQVNANAKLVRVKLDAKGLYILKAVSAGKEYSKKIMK